MSQGNVWNRTGINISLAPNRISDTCEYTRVNVSEPKITWEMIFCNNFACSGHSCMIKLVPEEDYLKDAKNNEMILDINSSPIECPLPLTLSHNLCNTDNPETGRKQCNNGAVYNARLPGPDHPGRLLF